MVRYYNNECRYNLKNKRLISKWLQQVAEAEGYELGNITYIFCSSTVHRKMNIDFVGHDYFTDIITFDYSDREYDRYVSGDIFIDVETVNDNSRIYNTSKIDEMHRVVVHGVLHLCGQKDKTPDEEQVMHEKEDKYLAMLNEMLKQEQEK